MKLNADGTHQAHVMAQMLWNIATENGHENAKTNRDAVVKEMTSGKILRVVQNINDDD